MATLIPRQAPFFRAAAGTGTVSDSSFAARVAATELGIAGIFALNPKALQPLIQLKILPQVPLRADGKKTVNMPVNAAILIGGSVVIRNAWRGPMTSTCLFAIRIGA
jgi:hypothetical protein